jgi:hypothetical protein
MKRSMQMLALFSIVTLGSSTVWAQFWPSMSNQANGPSSQQVWEDADGDGVCDNCGQTAAANRNQSRKGKSYGPGDGSGNQGQGPRDGSGYGAGSGRQAGDCDGTGPRGNRGGRGGSGGSGSRGRR